MALDLPYSLSPSKVSSFTDCALAFRFSAIDRLPEPPTVPATRGALVHRALERLYTLPSAERTLAAGLTELDGAYEELRTRPELTDLGLDEDQHQHFLDEAETMVRRYFKLEDPTAVHPIGLELNLELDVDGLLLRGVIDRLELDHEGSFVVTDYKTGKVRSAEQERARLGGVHFYSFLCEQLFGSRPARVQLLYLSEPVAITTTPTEQSTRGLERKLRAVWSEVERAYERDDFRPSPSRLCDWCAFKAFCPAFGGDPAEGRRLATERREETASVIDRSGPADPPRVDLRPA
jgi:putative RecB family exonuclease